MNEKIAKVVVTLVGGVAVQILKAWVLTIFWGWFIIPLGVNIHVSLWAMYGLLVMMSLIIGVKEKEITKEGTWESILTILFFSLLLSIISLGVGFIVHLLIGG